MAYIRDAGDNYLLFAFELELDVDKVLMGVPWSYDRHLVTFQRYVEKALCMKDLEFTMSLFWVQFHGLPFGQLLMLPFKLAKL